MKNKYILLINGKIMKILKPFLFLLSALLLMTCYNSCDDAGVVSNNQNVNFSQLNLPHLNPEEQVMYEIFVGFDTLADHNANMYISLGKFNINASGQPVDSAGNVKTIAFKNTVNLNWAGDAIVTLEPLIDNDSLPNGIKVMGSARTVVNGVLTFNMDMNYSEVLNNIPASLGDSAHFILSTPTDGVGFSEFTRGVWLTKDTLGNSAGMTSPTIPGGTGYIYHAWIADVSNPDFPIFYNVGRFSDPNAVDDYTGCQGLFPGYNKPGHDYISPAPGCANLANLNNGFFKIFVTLEPQNRIIQTIPYYLVVFAGPLGSSGYGIVSAMPNVSAAVLPTGTLTVTTTTGN